MSVPHAYRNYQRTTVETASPGKLIIMLYDGAIRFLEQAKRELSESRPKEAHYALVRAEDILSELMSSLDVDKGGDIAQNLLALYEFMFMRLVDANMRKDPAPIYEVLDFLRTLRESWNEAVSQQAADAHQDGHPQLSIQSDVPRRPPALFGSRTSARAPEDGANGPAASDGDEAEPASEPPAKPVPSTIPLQQLRQFQMQNRRPAGTNGAPETKAEPDPPKEGDDDAPPAPPKGGLDLVS